MKEEGWCLLIIGTLLVLFYLAITLILSKPYG